MHLTKHIITTIIILISAGHLASQNCLFDAQPIHINGAISTLFDEKSSITVSPESLIIGSDTIIASSVETVSFANLKELDILTECTFDINTDFHSTATGEIIQYSFPANSYGISKLDHIRLVDFDRTIEFTFINKQYLYEWINKQDYISRSSRFYSVDTNAVSTMRYVAEDNIIGSLTVTSDPVYETVTEQILLTSAYDSIIVTPSMFATEYYHYEIESSTCPEAVIEEVSEVVLVKDEHVVLSVTDAVLTDVNETVYEVVPYDGPRFYERQFLDLSDLDQVFTKNIEITSIETPCEYGDFIRCSEIQLIQDSITYATDLGSVYPACIEGYRNAGKFCYNFDAESAGTTTTRSYPKLDSPASVSNIIVPAEYKTITYHQVTNKDELDASCIMTTTDSVAYQRLVAPAVSEVIDIPATYGTREWMRVLTPTMFEVDATPEQVDSIVVNIGDVVTRKFGSSPHAVFQPYCMHEKINEKLKALSYVTDACAPLSVEYYNGILQFQKANRLWMGVIDQQFLIHINVVY